MKVTKKNKTKVILTCTGPSELTEFNKTWNTQVEHHCERPTNFLPTLACLSNTKDDNKCCKYLDLKIYKGV